MKLEMQKRSYKTVLAVIIAAVLVVCSVVIFADFKPHGKFTLTVLFTGDAHGDMQSMPQYYTLIQQCKKQGDVLLLDCGDLFEGGARQSEGGLPEGLVLSAMKYDAMVLGNNEFWTNENTAEACDAQISSFSQNVTFPVLCANVKKNEGYLNGVKPYTIINKRGLKIAVIGLTTDEINNEEIKNKTVTDPVKALDAVNAELEGKADIKIVLSHCEQEQNELFDGVHAVIAGHVHQPTKAPILGKNGTPIVRAGGKEQRRLGKLVLNLVEQDGVWSVESYDFVLLSAGDGYPDSKIAAVVAGINR